MKINECGHDERKHYARGMCKSCYDKQYWLARPEASARRNEKSQRWSKEHPFRMSEIAHASHLKRKYGIDGTEYQRRLLEQAFTCPCGVPFVMDEGRRDRKRGAWGKS